MKYLVIDTENTGALRNKAHPFDPRNRMALCGVYDGKTYNLYNIEYSPDNIYGDAIRAIQDSIDKAECLVGFNIKYDLHWLRSYGINFVGKQIWDCQLAEFILSNQTNRYPSLLESALARGCSFKKDTLQEYLDKDIDVDGIPLLELEDYLHGDLQTTYELFLEQKELIRPYWPLFNIQCQDLLVLQEMEWNGLKVNLDLCNQKVHDCLEEELSIKTTLALFVGDPFVNWSSTHHLNAILYGGTIKYEDRVPDGVYKTGAKTGLPKYKINILSKTYPRLVEPKDGTALQSPGLFSTAEPTLRELKATGTAKAIIDLVLRLSEVEKLRTTYFQGIPHKFVGYGWENQIMHGSINQCVARTGRTSSNNPNLQNIPEESKVCFESRY